MQDFAYRLDKDVRMAPVTVSDPMAVRGYGLVSPALAGVYLHHFASHATTVRNLTVTLDVPRAGKARWYSPESGEVLRRADVPAGHQTLEVPPFQVDIALLISPEEDGLQIRPTAAGGTANRTVASEGATWFPLQPVKDDFAPSVLDCSRFVETPTGKHGFVTVRQDQFVFEDGTPARFWGRR